MSDTAISDAAAVDAVLAHAGLRVTDDERERLIRLYPTVKSLAAQLCIPEARYAEPAIVYSIGLD
jgi:hypothetical protein